MANKDYYSILGVDKNATPEEIKKAFRKKAHECHPDKEGGDEAKFKEANEAYQVLGNEKKRKQYDQFGTTFEGAQAGGGQGQGQGFGGYQDFGGFNVDMDDLGDMFGGLGDIFGFGGGKSSRSSSGKGRDLETTMTISFEEAIFGVEKDFKIKRYVTCDRCQGNRAEPGSSIDTCKTCGGSGKVSRVQRTIFGNMQVQMTCSDCGGEGKSYSQKCAKCSGSGRVEETSTIKVNIPAGVDTGEVLRLAGQGEAGEGGARTGDLYVNIIVKESPKFQRQGYDIHSEREISFKQAALGDKVDIETIHGKVSLKIPAGTQSGTVFKLRNKGVRRLQGTGHGDHLIKVNIKTPTNLTRKQKKQIDDLDL